jgi:hypothetical protein
MLLLKYNEQSNVLRDGSAWAAADYRVVLVTMHR